MSTVTDHTPAQLDRINAYWNEIAAEPVTVQIIQGCLYASCTELAAFRLERKYNCRPHAEAIFSPNLSSWVFRLEPRFYTQASTTSSVKRSAWELAKKLRAHHSSIPTTEFANEVAHTLEQLSLHALYLEICIHLGDVPTQERLAAVLHTPPEPMSAINR